MLNDFFIEEHIKNHKKWILKKRIDSRREVKPRFGCRELPGTTETLVAKKVDSQRILFQKKVICF